MRNEACKKKKGKNEFTLDCSLLTDKVFINAIKIRDICQFVILPRSEKKLIKPGSPDVKILSITGEKYNITRQELINNFVYCDLSKIKIIKVRSGKAYIVFKESKDSYGVMRIPNNVEAIFNGRKVKKGSYIVCKKDEKGNILLDTMTFVSENMFRKAFVIPMQPIIKRNMTGESHRELNVNRKKAIQTFKEKQDNKQALSVSDKKAIQVSNIKTEKAKYKYRVTYRLNEAVSGKMVGYRLLQIDSNKQVNATIDDVFELCRKKEVENVELVVPSNGNRSYLKGNGISLESLKVLLV